MDGNSAPETDHGSDPQERERKMLQETAAATPLIGCHRALGAHLVDYAGWTMPVRYGSAADEHRAVRERAGIFDVSHMGELWIEGTQAAQALDFALIGEAQSLAVGRAEYSMICTEEGGIIDDLIVYRLDAEQFLVVSNAGNTPSVGRELGHRIAGFDATLRDETYTTSLIALQGPLAERILAGESGPAVRELRRYSIGRTTVCGYEALVARTGYTGEDGFEIFTSWKDGPHVWNGLLYSADLGGPVPAGLAARDTLRLEAAMPLYGNELDRKTNPYEAGLGWVVKLDKAADFIGKAALETASATPASKKLIGLVVQGRGIARSHYPIFRPEAEMPCGEITSGAPSPTLGMPIALAYTTDVSVRPGDILEVGIRSDRVAAEAVTLPFYRRGGNGNGSAR